MHHRGVSGRSWSETTTVPTRRQQYSGDVVARFGDCVRKVYLRASGEL
jgi:hypothetical protein